MGLRWRLINGPFHLSVLQPCPASTQRPPSVHICQSCNRAQHPPSMIASYNELKQTNKQPISLPLNAAGPFCLPFSPGIEDIRSGEPEVAGRKKAMDICLRQGRRIRPTERQTRTEIRLTDTGPIGGGTSLHGVLQALLPGPLHLPTTRPSLRCPDWGSSGTTAQPTDRPLPARRQRHRPSHRHAGQLPADSREWSALALRHEAEREIRQRTRRLQVRAGRDWHARY